MQCPKCRKETIGKPARCDCGHEFAKAGANGSEAGEESIVKSPQQEMSDDLQSWGFWLIVLGIAHFVFAGFLEPGFGVILIFLGVLNLAIRHRAMYVVDGLALVGIGLWNVSGGAVGGWTVFGVIQIVLGIREIAKGLLYRAEPVPAGLKSAKLSEPEPVRRSQGPMPGPVYRKPVSPQASGPSASSQGPWLLFKSGSRAGDSIPLRPQGLTIGRAGDSGLVLSDPKVSRRHAQISYGGGSFFVEDLSSSNGTALNHTRVKKAPLRPGALLRIGDTDFVFTKDEPTPAGRAPGGRSAGTV